jgi:fermentation-respiration switch protein FrsA (DUF1100 family)
MTAIKWILIAGVGLYATLVAVLFVAQRALMYPIPQASRTTPAAAGFPQAEEHILPTSDGERVVIWHVPPRGDRPVVIFFHGNGEVLAWRVPRFRALTSDGTGLIALSFRGYGGSSGTPSEAGLLSDADAAYAFAAARYPPERLAVWGFSLGTGPAVALAARQRIGRLILEAPYSSTVEVAAARFPLVPVRLLMHDQFKSDLRIADVTAPLLIVHGESDRWIPIAFGEKLYGLARGSKRMIRFPGAGHENLDDFGALEAVRTFLAAS